MAGAGSDNDSAADAERAAHLVKEGEEGAIAWSMQEIDRRYAGLATTFGTKARRYTRQDLRCHLEFLASSLATCEPAYFVAYVRWQTGILKSRGIPIGTLNESLSLLMQFFDGRLDQAARAKVAQIMQGGLAAVIADLRDDDPLASALRPLREVEALTLSLIRGDVATVRSIAAQAGGGRRYLRVATRLFQPSLYAVGHLWAQNKISVAQEHLATAVTQTTLAQLLLEAEYAEPVERQAVFACVEGDHHALGLRIVADAFELIGWSVRHLGGNVPAEALLKQVEEWRPEMVGLSVTMVHRLPSLRKTVRTMRDTFGSRCPTVLVGGLATNQIGQVGQWVGADHWCADAEAAINWGRAACTDMH